MASYTLADLKNLIMRASVPSAVKKLIRDVTDSTQTAGIQELTVSGAVDAGVRGVELNHATVVVAATMDPPANGGFVVIKDTSASGTAAHTLTMNSGTLNGTNTIATLNAPNECLVVYFDSAGNGTIVENVGSVALSGP